MADALIEAWRDFSLSAEQFGRIVEEFAAAIDDGLAQRPSSLQMLPAYIGRPAGDETGIYLALDFGGTNLRVAEVELTGKDEPSIRKLHKVSLKNDAAGYDYTGADTNVRDLFAFIARQIGQVADGQERFLGHSFSYASRQTALGRATFLGWAKEIKVSGLTGQDINGLLAEELRRQQITTVHPVAVLNDTTATLLAAAYARADADLGSVCGTGHNTAYYERQPRHGEPGRVMAYNPESGGFDRLSRSRFDEELDRDSDSPGRQRLEKMVAGRYLGDLVRRILRAGRGDCGLQFIDELPCLGHPDGLSSIDVARFVGDRSKDLEHIDAWLREQLPGRSSVLAERHFIKAAAELVVERAATLVAASYAGFLYRLDRQRRQRHVIGVNGSLYEKMPGFAAGIQAALTRFGGWPAEQVDFLVVEEAPLVGAAIAAAIAGREEAAR
jgi:hexokinase